jgi:lysozyme family protein
VKKNWEAAFQWLIEEEGGFANDPRDNGGMTMLGVTQANWEAYVGRQVDEKEMRALTPDVVKPFYQTRYWNKIKGDGLPSGVDYCVFDMAVNSGPVQAARFIQRVCAVPVDGIIGPKSLDAIHADDPAELIEAFCSDRLSFLKSLSGFATFGRGWTVRVERVQRRALSLLS